MVGPSTAPSFFTPMLGWFAVSPGRMVSFTAAASPRQLALVDPYSPGSSPLPIGMLLPNGSLANFSCAQRLGCFADQR